MRTMEIRPFPRSGTEIPDLEKLLKGRLVARAVFWPDQAGPLVGYMAWPNDPDEREQWIHANQSDDQSKLDSLCRGLKTIQQHWARVADVVHTHHDLWQGQHQKRRGGASIGKAISLVSENAKSKGTGAAKLWEIWKTYKDVAHLVTAAVLVAAEAQTRHRREPYGLKLREFQPYRMAMALPDLVIAVAMTIEKFGLEFVPYGRSEPLLDPQSLWRIPTDINLAPLPLPARQLMKTDLDVLNARRAGNRGTANRRETTPVFG